MNRTTAQSEDIQTAPWFYLYQLKPCFKVFLCDLTCFAGSFFLPGLLAPGIEFLCGKRSRLYSGKPPLILPAVILGYIVGFLAESPLGDSAYLLAGTAPVVKRTIAVFCCGTASHSEVPSAVFADPHLHLLLDALAEMIVDQIINGVRLQNFCKDIIAEQLEDDGLGMKAECVISGGFIIRRHSLRNSFCAVVYIQDVFE